MKTARRCSLASIAASSFAYSPSAAAWHRRISPSSSPPPAQLEDERRRFTLSPPEIAKINPNTRTAPVFRSRRDAELTATIYNRVPVLIEEGKDSGNPWGLSFMAMFHMSNDSGSFRTAAQLAEEGFQREGTNWVREAREQAGVTARRQLQTDLLATAENDRNDLLSNLQVAASAPGPARAVVAAAHIERYVPLYEAKMFDQFNHRYSDYSSRGDDRGNRVLPELTIQQLNDPDHEVVPFLLGAVK
ncbi:hypothetical protein ACFSTD_00035 [Novosphingobium colocasiae]